MLITWSCLLLLCYLCLKKTQPVTVQHATNSNTCGFNFMWFPVVLSIWRRHLSSPVSSITSACSWWTLSDEYIGEILIRPDFRLRDRSVILIAYCRGRAATRRQVPLFLKPEAPEVLCRSWYDFCDTLPANWLEHFFIRLVNSQHDL